MNEQVQENSENRPPESAHAAFLAWEKLRLVYNTILLCEVLVTCACIFGWSEFGNMRFWWNLAYCCFAANVCFCVGPWAEGWLTMLAGDRHAVRAFIFVLGTLFACILAAAAIYGGLFSGLGHQ